MTNKSEHYQVLANKYRPETFKYMIGQEALVQTLSNAIEQNRIANAFLLTGIRGIGKTTTARIIAKILNCVGKDGNGGPTVSPCGQCHQCTSISQSRHPDVLEVDAASRTGVDDIREIIDNSNYLPATGRYKIYIIDEVHMLSKNAFNALLKTIEEPPEHVKFIFATTEIRKIPVTVLSRCQRFDLKRIETTELQAHLASICKREQVTADDDALYLIAKLSEGSVRDSLSLLDQAMTHSQEKLTSETILNMAGLSDTHHIIDMFESLASGSIDSALTMYHTLHKDGADITLLMHDLLHVIHHLTLCTVSNQITIDAPKDQVDRYKKLAETLDVGYLSRCWQIGLRGLDDIKRTPNAFIAGQMILIKLAYMSSLPSPETIIKGLTEKSSQSNKAATANQATLQSHTQSSPVTATSSRINRSALNVAPAPLDQPNLEPSIHTSGPGTFEETVELFKDHGEVLLHSWLTNDVRCIEYTPGKLNIYIPPTLPSNFSQRIIECLNNWTNTRWIASIQNHSNQPTLKEKLKKNTESLKQSLSEHPQIAKILKTFPEAKISHIEKI